MRFLEKYAKHGLDAVASEVYTVRSRLALAMPSYIRRAANVAEADGNMAATRWIYDTFKKEYESAEVMALYRARGQLYRLGNQPTSMQQRLRKIVTRVGGPKPSHTSQHLVQPSVAVQQDPAGHAKKFQSMFESTAQETKKPAQVQPSHSFGAAQGWKL